MAASDTSETPDEAMVMAPWEAIYANVLAGHAGERIEATARVEDWRETPGWTWRWCRDRSGREGWAPEALLTVDGMEATLREDYDARELTVAPGDRLSIERELAGWALCHTPDGARGWVPLECLERITTRSGDSVPPTPA